ncbi:hypothetical protein CY34DRAFT_25514 [Suillus luteus UH-Slu-Lm8-n1]|uniref:DDE family endonuclease n=1 Tax=Suillus luteus UH-Slu-Lm8-n1 TaxID=930992 RepID=A0A0D0AAE4_9AGAM|nr:hypothetical protein CY34DRAFT_25514 [Suillus luteus UH-Slu-Lm8-n1]
MSAKRLQGCSLIMRNIEELQNQLHAASVLSTSESNDSKDMPSKRMKLSHSRARAPSPASVSDHSSEENWQPPTVFDSLKFTANDDESDIESNEEDITHSDDLDDSNCCSRLIDFAASESMDDDPHDETWLPPRKAKCRAQQIGRPNHYKKGPDVGSKSARTRRRYKQLLQNQKPLTSLGFTIQPKLYQSTHVTPATEESSSLTSHQHLEPDSESEEDDLDADIMSPMSETPAPDSQLSTGLACDAEEIWEDELEEEEQAGVDIRGWDELREQIKKDLTKGGKTLPLSRVNQLLLVRNFATLRLKGRGRIAASLEIAHQWHEGEGAYFARKVQALARHYQVFEQLPIEKRGGRENALSPLKDERLQLACRQWLTSQPIGEITPRKFQHALNNIIIPSLNTSLPRQLSERTARRWLIKLGWQRTVLRKGVYMDGHEHEDVKKYRQEVFLPAMAAFESHMALSCVEMVAVWHDESCFHANDYKTRAYLLPGQQILQKKGRGRIIHVSGFIDAVDGRLALRDKEGEVVEEARKIIYPGANGSDAWWDTAQLLAQMKDAIRIFEAAHPNRQALFIFDQSSAHASLPEDALRAFDMNKSNGGKQRHRQDTVIPQSNPCIEHRGKIQKMTLPDGSPKGLKQVLEERGFDVRKLRAKCAPVCPWESTNCCMACLLSQQEDFTNQPSMLETLIKKAGHECIFLPKFHCELNPIEMYWGWCKYRYREVPKKTFEDAKRCAKEQLDACPTEVIRRFINRSWRFMSAYCLGLTGKAAEWAVQKQKQHRQVSQRAMMSIEAVLDRA